MLYAQLARDSGWNAYKTVFNIYDKLPDECRPKTQKEKDNMWMVTFSKVVKTFPKIKKKKLLPSF
jgi:hypothetical protein